MIESRDVRLMEDDGSSTLREQQVTLLKDLEDLDHKYHLMMLQKARIHWSIEGDENSGFFHGVLNRRLRQLAIHGVMVDGVWVDEPNYVKEEFQRYYESLFS